MSIPKSLYHSFLNQKYLDFGPGFYMWSDPFPAKTIVLQEDTPACYELFLNSDIINNLNILFLKGMQWVYTIIACLDIANDYPVLKPYRDCLKAYDIVFGLFPNDGGTAAIHRFKSHCITDICLLNAMNHFPGTLQINARTKKACSAIQIIQKHTIDDSEKRAVIISAINRRKKDMAILSETTTRHKRDGVFFDELLQDEAKLLSYLPKGYNPGNDYD